MFTKKKEKPGSINFAKRMQQGLTDKFLNWAFTIGRAILMIVYAVALGAFIYRFGLDREVIDLGDKIEQQQTIVTLTSKDENTYRDLQNKLSFIKQTEETSNTEITLLDEIITLANGRILFTALSISSSEMSMSGSARSISSLNRFLEDIRALPQVSSVSLGTIESRVDQGVILFDTTATLK